VVPLTQRRLPAILAAALWLSGTACSEDVELLVELRTDFVPGIEFTGVEVELFVSPPGGDAAARARTRTPAFFSEDYLDPVRVAEFRSLEPGPHFAVVTLLDAGGGAVVERTVDVSVGGTTGITVVAARSCRSRTCPEEGDDPASTACLFGRCVDPRCTPETPEHCPGPLCMDVADCGASAACATGRCIEGGCLVVATPGACATDEYCHPERGCQVLPLGPPPDAGPPPVAGCASTCVGCEPCGSGSEGDYAPSADEDLPGGIHQYESFTIPLGVTVTVTGSDPLTVLSRGVVRIAGSLVLDGAPGEDAACSATDYVPGGAGGAGGGAGGGGRHCCGAPGLDGEGSGGGGGGQQTGSGAGGGGAGAFVAGESAGPGCDDGFAGLAGAAYDAFTSDPLEGGSGGGGGSPANGANGPGGGGGGGGGGLKIVAPEIRVEGIIRASGGAGGAAPSGCGGGGGGGGSGGNLWLRGTTVVLDGSVETTGGSGGPTPRNSLCGSNPGRGGAGASGSVRIDAVTARGASTSPTALGGPPCDEAMCL